MNTKTHQAASKAKSVIKMSGKVVLFAALHYGPAGIAGWAVKSVARRPLKMLLAVALEPLLSRVAKRLSRRFTQNPPR